MANTQELDRLLDELRLTSVNMNAGLGSGGAGPPPPKPVGYSNNSSYSTSRHHQEQAFNRREHGTSTESRSRSSRHHHVDNNIGGGGARAILLDPQHSAGNMNNTNNTNTNNSSSRYYTNISERRQPRGFERQYDSHRPVVEYNTSSYLPPMSPSMRNSQHETTYTTTLRQMTPNLARHCSEVHLTIDPEQGKAQSVSITPRMTSNHHHSSININTAADSTDRQFFRRESQLESELRSARQELAQLKRAMSMVEDRRRQESTTIQSPSSYLAPVSPSASLHTPAHPQFQSAASSTMYQTTQHSARST